MIYSKKDLSDSICDNISSQYHQYVDLLNGLQTFNKLMNGKSSLKHTELFHGDKLTIEIRHNCELSLILNKNYNEVGIEFSFDYENSKLNYFRRDDFLDYLEERYGFNILRDYFGTTFKSSSRCLHCYLIFYNQPTFEQISKFCSDLINNNIDGGVNE